ncbi:MAG TPA: hypothetical protein VF529_08840 [Solirubrobacteraceae bacterium]
MASSAAPATATSIAPLDRPVAAKPLLLDMTATIPLTGRAAPGAPVDLSARCALLLCVTRATANRKGRWRARLHVVVPPTRTTLFVRSGDGATRQVTLTTPEPVAGAPQLAMIGDSLAEGTEPYLAAALPGWRVTTDAARSRFLLDGMAIRDAMRKPAKPVALAFSLFTNDDPRRAPELAQAAARSLDGLPSGSCAIWATIARPKVAGVSYAQANAALDQVAASDPRIRIVPWAEGAKRHRDWLRDDRVHATAEGYAARAQLYAQAAAGCGL